VTRKSVTMSICAYKTLYLYMLYVYC